MQEENDGGGLDLGGSEEHDGQDPFADVPADVPGEDGEEQATGLGGEGATLEDLKAEEEAAASAGAEEPEPEPAPAAEEPEPAPEPAPESESKATKKEGTAERPYVVLVEQKDGTWDTATQEPIIATNGEVALREAYAELVPPEQGDEKTLVVIPVHYWKPKKVSAKKKVSRALEIS